MTVHEQTSAADKSYRQQLARLAQAMSQANHEKVVLPDLAQGMPPTRIKMFVDGNLEKRLDKLTKQLEFVAEIFDDFESLIVQYIREVPLSALGSSAGDGERMLQWLNITQQLTPRQQDYVTCQNSRQNVENLARSKRALYIRFQELLSLTDGWFDELERNVRLNVYLNPICAWSRFVTSEFLNEEDTPPVNVIFFPVSGQVTTAVLEPRGQALIDELSGHQPCRLSEWIRQSGHDADEIVAACRDMAQIGLVAFG